MPHPDHHARRAAQSARSLAKLATVAAGNGRRTALLGARVAIGDAPAQEHDIAPGAGEQRESALDTATRAWATHRG
jgi:hypothetical protein